jgi:uncharacterized protein YciW
MLEFSEHLTIEPASISEEHHEALGDHGWKEEDIVDMVHIVALYAYMNRIAHGLGVEMEADSGWEPLMESLPF